MAGEVRPWRLERDRVDFGNLSSGGIRGLSEAATSAATARNQEAVASDGRHYRPMPMWLAIPLPCSPKIRPRFLA
ncbi:MAG: hypothetical protein U1D30_23350 [Planctomycetota bacterium]